MCPPLGSCMGREQSTANAVEMSLLEAQVDTIPHQKILKTPFISLLDTTHPFMLSCSLGSCPSWTHMPQQ